MKLKNEFKAYLIIWAMAFIIFNILVIIFKQEIIGDRIVVQEVVFNNGIRGQKNVLNPVFVKMLMSYAFVFLAFIGQLICTKIFLSQETLRKTLYHYPLFKLSLIGLFITIIFALVFCFTDINPIISFIVFLFTMFFTIASCISAKTAANMVSAKESNLDIKVQYIKLLRNESEAVLVTIKDKNEKNLVNKVVEEIRYSDPLSVPELFDVEKNMIEKFNIIKENINKDKFDILKNACDDLSNLIKERNIKVKSLKN